MQPLVSCILPTRNRSAYIRLALTSYLSQTYPNKELIVLDNGEDGTASLMPVDPSIRYLKVSGQRTTGEMRNLCCEEARGEVICHFDSDDWSAPTRIERQLVRLGPFMMTGYRTMLFYDERSRKAYYWSTKREPFALGTSLCYRRDWWQQHPFESLMVGEDFRFFMTAVRAKQVTTDPVGFMQVALVHDHQTCKKTLNPQYQMIPVQQVPQGFFDAFQRHQ